MSGIYRTPDIQFIDIDTETLVNEMAADFTSATGRRLADADPMRMVLLWAADILARQRFVIDSVAKMNCPRYAEGEFLDLLCELFDRAGRRSASAAKTTIQFTISEKRSSSVIVPAGVRIRGENNGKSAVFATEEEVIITPGKLTGEVSAVCTESGAIGNGFPAGTITECVDIFNYYSGCQNITESEGGADTETDEEFYEQMRKSLEGYSTAGPEGSYEYYAKAANAGIADVKAVSEKEEITVTLPVWRMTSDADTRCVMIGGEQILTDAISVSSGEIPGESGTDYRIDYDGALLKIDLLSGGALSDCDEVSVTYTRERAGRVRVSVLMENGGIPGSEVLDQANALLSAENIRPMTDIVTVTAPDIVTYNIDLTYYIPYGGASGTAAELAVEQAVNQFIAWQSEVMGRDINPSKLNEMVMQTGLVKRVVIREPEYSVIGDCAVAKLGTRAVIGGGREYE